MNPDAGREREEVDGDVARVAPPTAAPTPVRAFLRRRARSIVAMGACAGVATVVAAPYPERSEEGVSRLLSEAVGGPVAKDEFVWEASGGFVDDLVFGRRVLFLARTTPDGPRDLYRARVSVTREGRPLRVRSIVDLTNTDLADESGLAVVGREAVVASQSSGRVRALQWLGLGAPRPGSFGRRDPLDDVDLVVVSFADPPTRERHELQSGALVLSLGDDAEAVAVDRATLAVSAASDRHGARAVRARLTPAGQAPSAASLGGVLVTPAPAVGPFPPNGSVAEPLPGWDAAPSPLFVSKSSGRVTAALDMRQLRLVVVPAVDSPRSRTGYRPDGALPEAAVIAIAASSEPWMGAFEHGNRISPFEVGSWAIVDGEAPTLRRASNDLEWAAGDERAGRPPSAMGFAAAPAGSGERAVLCATASGHFVYSWGAHESDDSIRASLDGIDCVARLPLDGRALGAAVTTGARGAWKALDPSMSMHWADAGETVPILAFVQNRLEPTVAPPRGAHWEPEGPQPDPAFAPSIYRASVDALGARVDVRLFVAGRFDWVLRAGADEKTHRMGGQFEKALSDGDAARAYFAIGVGIGKRRSPSGLRIAGSLGHAFHREAMLVAAGPAKLAVGRALPEPAEVDASELIPTASGGALLPGARERGPRQARGDLCVRDDGTVLYAEAEFDNHEATATVLQDLGCLDVVGLDRGADQPAWTQRHDQVTKTHDATTLFALARPSLGPVRVDPGHD